MSNILDLVTSQLGQQGMAKISQQLGVSQDQSSTAIAAALPVLMGALARNAQQPEGAEALAGALDRDHDGSILNHLDGFLQQPEKGAGAGILGHVLGSKRPRVEDYVAKTSGLDSQGSGKLLEMLAPVVMGALGQQKRQQGLDASGLSGMLGGLLNSNAIGQQAPGVKAGQGNALLNALLDSDKDGDITDDLLSMGGKMLGGLFGRKR